MTAIISFLLTNKWTWYIGIALAVILCYFGWRAHERGVGAARIVDQIKAETEKARARGDKAAAEYRRDGASKRMRSGDY